MSSTRRCPQLVELAADSCCVLVVVDCDVGRRDELAKSDGAHALVDEPNGADDLETLLVQTRRVLAEGLVHDEGEELAGEREER